MAITCIGSSPFVAYRMRQRDAEIMDVLESNSGARHPGGCVQDHLKRRHHIKEGHDEAAEDTRSSTQCVTKPEDGHTDNHKDQELSPARCHKIDTHPGDGFRAKYMGCLVEDLG